MDDVMCPNCGTTKYRNPELKLLINVCGHSFCEKCVDILFSRGSCICYECKQLLRKANFRPQRFDDPSVDKEIDVRKKVIKELNLFQEDFCDLREYNDFLESVEDIVFDMVNNTNVEEAKQKMDEIKRSKSDIILRNKYKLSKDQQEIRKQIQIEKETFEEMRRKVVMEEMMAERAKRDNKMNLLKELQYSNMPADLIVNKHQQDVNTLYQNENKLQFSTTELHDTTDHINPNPSFEQEVLYNYEKPQLHFMGPLIPERLMLESDEKSFLEFVYSPGDDEKAGGYHKHFACERAISDAFNCLFS